MKSILALCLLTLALAASPEVNSSDMEKAETLIYENNNDGSGNYKFRYKLSDGTEHFQRSYKEDDHIVIKGRYTYVAPEGIIYVVRYTADENGYTAEIEEGSGAGNPLVLASMLG